MALALAFQKLPQSFPFLRFPLVHPPRRMAGYGRVRPPMRFSRARRLRKAGSDHRKFLRQVFVSVDVTAPLYWWKEYDTYKVATVANSTSTMHKIHSKPFELSDFSCDHMTEGTLAYFETVIAKLEEIRLRYVNEGKNKEDWYDLIQLLPSSYNQLRTCTFNYETLINIYFARRNHKLLEWHTFCDWILTLRSDVLHASSSSAAISSLP